MKRNSTANQRRQLSQSWIRAKRMTQEMFFARYTHYFCPTVLCSCQENELPATALLLLDTSPWSNCQPWWSQKHLWTSQLFTCHQHCITFATNGPGGNSNLHGSGESFEQDRKNYQGLLVWKALIIYWHILGRNVSELLEWRVMQTSPRNYAWLYTIWASGEHC